MVSNVYYNKKEKRIFFLLTNISKSHTYKNLKLAKKKKNETLVLIR
jgi:hypothetical protein